MTKNHGIGDRDFQGSTDAPVLKQFKQRCDATGGNAKDGTIILMQTFLPFCPDTKILQAPFNGWGGNRLARLGLGRWEHHL